VRLMDFSISSTWNANASQTTFFETLSACSASFLTDMTRISKGMNHRVCNKRLFHRHHRDRNWRHTTHLRHARVASFATKERSKNATK
jgi:hypothetical protein